MIITANEYEHFWIALWSISHLLIQSLWFYLALWEQTIDKVHSSVRQFYLILKEVQSVQHYATMRTKILQSVSFQPSIYYPILQVKVLLIPNTFFFTAIDRRTVVALFFLSLTSYFIEKITKHQHICAYVQKPRGMGPQAYSVHRPWWLTR